MINNRQNGRRRGRGGGPRSPNNAPNPGNNRQDNRSRGNAAQLHEKYKAMARDAQLAGDRVQTEYYLQFADHYFRVLNENRSRFEEQRRPQGDYMSDEDEDQDQDEGVNAEAEEAQGRQEREERYERQPRRDRYEADDRGEREQRNDRDQRSEREPRPEREARQEGEGRGNGLRPRRERIRRDRPQEASEGSEGGSEERISLDVLPPAIANDTEEAAKAPRRRTRRPRDGEEIAPAA
ncbi:MAG TPA: DUF4167 domain-containing protein [Allosphingosinicella sp.]